MRNIAHVVLAAFIISGCAKPSAAPPVTAPAATGVPSTDVYVYRLSRSLIPFRSRLTNVTRRPGYDNQPSWDRSSILFTSIRDGQADIYRHVDDTTARVTSTPESEYSPSISPDGGMSVVRVERDSTQRLWRFPPDGGAPNVVLPGVKPVGYYAWLDSTTVALYILGDPDTLQIADTRSGRSRVVTTDIGRSLQRVPDGLRVSFVRHENGKWVLRTAGPVVGESGAFEIRTVTTLPDSAEYVSWRSATELYSASGSRIYRLRLPSGSWERIADLAGNGLKHITRLAVSPDGSSLAIVAEDNP